MSVSDWMGTSGTWWNRKMLAHGLGRYLSGRIWILELVLTVDAAVGPKLGAFRSRITPTKHWIMSQGDLSELDKGVGIHRCMRQTPHKSGPKSSRAPDLLPPNCSMLRSRMPF